MYKKLVIGITHNDFHWASRVWPKKKKHCTLQYTLLWPFKILYFVYISYLWMPNMVEIQSYIVFMVQDFESGLAEQFWLGISNRLQWISWPEFQSSEDLNRAGSFMWLAFGAGWWWERFSSALYGPFHRQIEYPHGMVVDLMGIPKENNVEITMPFII